MAILKYGLMLLGMDAGMSSGFGFMVKDTINLIPVTKPAAMPYNQKQCLSG